MKPITFVDFHSEVKEYKKKYIESFGKTLSSGNFILGNAVKKFENDFAKYLGIKYCIGVANGLEAIQIALMSLNIGKGDEVITTPVSAVATTLAIMAVGAKPVFMDITENGLLDPKLVIKAITKKTRAILPVHLYGNNSYTNELLRICKKNKLFLIEDAAQAHGSTFGKKKLGTIGDVGCFSFYPTKNLGAFGDGGAIVTNNPKIAKICSEIRDYGQERKYIHGRIGLNSRLDEVHAEMLSTKLKFLDTKNKKRMLIAKRYVKNLNHPLIKIVKNVSNSHSNFHLFVIRTKQRDELKEFLAKNNIPTAIHYPLVIPDQPFFKKKLKDLEKSRQFVKEILSLPCNPYLTFEQIDFISSTILDFFKSEIEIKKFNKLPDKISLIVQKLKKETYQKSGIIYSKKQKEIHGEKFCSEKSRFKYLLALENGQIVGGSTLLKREIIKDGKKILLGGIAGAWVKTDNQNNGIGTKIIKKSIEELRNRKSKLIFIQVENSTLYEFYEQFGFKPLNKYTFLGKSDKRYFEKNGMIGNISSTKLFKEILSDKKPFDIGKGNW